MSTVQIAEQKRGPTSSGRYHLSLPLLVRSMQYPDEDESGYVLRLAHLNGLYRSEWLFAKLSLTAHARARFCCQCLSERGYWHRSWSESSAPICEKHKVWLQDRCPSCSQLLRWRYLRLSHCRCGEPLSGTKACEVEDVVFNALRELDVPWSVLLWCGSIDLVGLKGKPHKVASRSEMSTVMELAARGAACLLSWPHGFQALLARIRTPSIPGHAQLTNEAFPGLAKSIRQLADPNWRTRIARGLDDFIRSTSSSASPIWHRTKSPADGDKLLRVIAREAGYGRRSVGSVLSLMPIDRVIRRICESGRNRLAPQSNATELAMEQLTQHCSCTFAAASLHVSIMRVRELVAHEVLEPTWRNGVTRRSLESLILRLCENLFVAKPKKSSLPWSDALRTLVPSRFTHKFFDSICSGTLRLYCPQKPDDHYHDLRTTYLLIADVNSWLIDQRSGVKVAPHSWFSVTEAGEQLGFKSEVAYHLVNHGLLEAELRHSGKRSAAMVSQESIDRFSARFIPLSRIAKQHCIAPQCSAHWARSMHLSVVSGPDVDGGRQYFVEKPPLCFTENSSS